MSERQMSVLATTPQEAVALADDAFNRGDLDGMLAYYEEDAIMLFAPGQAVRGHEALRAALSELLALKPVARPSGDSSHRGG